MDADPAVDTGRRLYCRLGPSTADGRLSTADWRLPTEDRRL